jgi:hypothetical protein
MKVLSEDGNELQKGLEKRLQQAISRLNDEDIYAVPTTPQGSAVGEFVVKESVEAWTLDNHTINFKIRIPNIYKNKSDPLDIIENTLFTIKQPPPFMRLIIDNYKAKVSGINLKSQARKKDFLLSIAISNPHLITQIAEGDPHYQLVYIKSKQSVQISQHYAAIKQKITQTTTQNKIYNSVINFISQTSLKNLKADQALLEECLEFDENKKILHLTELKKVYEHTLTKELQKIITEMKIDRYFMHEYNNSNQLDSKKTYSETGSHSGSECITTVSPSAPVHQGPSTSTDEYEPLLNLTVK